MGRKQDDDRRHQDDRMDDRVAKLEDRVAKCEDKLADLDEDEIDEEGEERRGEDRKADDRRTDDRLGQSDAAPTTEGTVQGNIPPGPEADQPDKGSDFGQLPGKDRVPFSVGEK